MIFNETINYFTNWWYIPVEEVFVYSCHLVICTLVYFLSIVTLGTLTLRNLRARFTNHQEDQRTKDMMRRMTIIVAINSVVYLMLIVWEFTIGLLFPDMNSDEQSNMLMCVSDMLSFSMPYTLLICDRNVRDVIFGQNLFSFQLRSNGSSVGPRV
ncbi:unnamed protein product [Caenorhabditis angaria]|uniref:Serpentine receptor class gamma n=1 Tax=Caenorhabditis angaria TaxID=860376 RepID=A0A9P1J4D7_9PELO|nr:unnamed protein product [Caenorhabditis angaria]